MTEYWLTTSVENTKLMAFKGESRLEIKLDNTIIEQKISLIT
jgi:hypothetical protein